MADESDIDVSISFRSGRITAARTEFAKEADRDGKAAIKALAKPTSPAWAVNQLHDVAQDMGRPGGSVESSRRAPRGTLRQESGPAGPDATIAPR